MEAASEQDSSYYALLSVPREASEELIRRRFRTLAQTCHPDKHPDSKEAADVTFRQLQEAYEVLSDPVKRQVYDVYGKQGLAAGLEVGTHLDTAEELKRKWAEFQAQQEAHRKASAMTTPGLTMVRLDATDCLHRSGRLPWVPALPEVQAISTNHQMLVPLTDIVAGFIGGQVAVRLAPMSKRGGAGAFSCGLRSRESEWSSTAFEAIAGLSSMVAVSNTRRLTPHASATLGATYTAGQGPGMTVSTTRQLSKRATGELSWVVGPASARGMVLAVSWQGDKLMALGKLQVGGITGITVRLTWKPMDGLAARLQARVSTGGIDVELGLVRRLSEFSTVGLAATVGLQGVMLKPSLHYGGTQRFEFPILLSQTLDVRVAAAAYLVPPVATLVVRWCLWRPLYRRWQLHKALKQREEAAEAIREGLQRAAAAQQLMLPVSVRKARAEAQQRGLLIISARYGTPDALLKAVHEDRSGMGAAAQQQRQAEQPRPSRPGAQSPDRPGYVPADATEAIEGAAEEQEAAALLQRAEALTAHLPPPWLDVTVPLRFMVEQGQLPFPQGVPKSGLMGFCDVAPGEVKVLRVQLVCGGQAYSAELRDQEGGSLPSLGTLVRDSEEVEQLQQAAQHFTGSWAEAEVQ